MLIFYTTLFTWLRVHIMVGVAQGTVRDIRADLFDKLQTLTLRYFDARTHGELNGFIEETVSRQKVVKAFRLE